MKIFNTEYKDIEPDYIPDIIKQSENGYKLMEILSTLPNDKRTILIVYAELGSIRKVAKVFNVSPSTIYNYLTEIRSNFKQ